MAQYLNNMWNCFSHELLTWLHWNNWVLTTSAAVCKASANLLNIFPPKYLIVTYSLNYKKHKNDAFSEVFINSINIIKICKNNRKPKLRPKRHKIQNHRAHTIASWHNMSAVCGKIVNVSARDAHFFPFSGFYYNRLNKKLNRWMAENINMCVNELNR